MTHLNKETTKSVMSLYWMIPFVFFCLLSLAAVIMAVVATGKPAWARLLLLLCGISLPLFGWQALSEQARQEQRLGDITYLEYWRSTLDAMPVEAAYTTSHLNLRTGPTTNHDVISVLPPDTRVVMVRTQPVNNSWFRVSAEEGIGYVHGRYIRPERKREELKYLGQSIRSAFRYAFPESTLKDKLIGWLLSIPISVGISLVCYMILGTSFRILGTRISSDIWFILVPGVYFAVKNRMFVHGTREEYVVFMLSWILVSLFAAIPSTFISTLITEDVPRLFPQPFGRV